MSTEAARVPLTTADTPIHITHRTARWDDRPATLSDALDFYGREAHKLSIAPVVDGVTVVVLGLNGGRHTRESGRQIERTDSDNRMDRLWRLARPSIGSAGH